MWLATTTLDSTGLEHRLVALLRVRIYKKMMIKFIFQIGNGKKKYGHGLEMERDGGMSYVRRPLQ